ncbi:hypothetical protein N7E02_07715 (plasmid) [Aliirhizobium terrae]|uniref:hypothetical protein n=1 Tax=Terrirhizobium terrae TaxID=2926709 RepID=UPI0025771DB2|nr:hypothetical protein [Rhizobium sp. CC-CFT758]WJH38493.1 hypothetical protein N7E02_07715 [Rhizobium sp. CC-CFT758]
MKSRPQNRDHHETHRFAPQASSKNAGTQPDIVPANEETEGATGALETPTTPPEMTKDGKPESNKEGKS